MVSLVSVLLAVTILPGLFTAPVRQDIPETVSMGVKISMNAPMDQNVSIGTMHPAKTQLEDIR